MIYIYIYSHISIHVYMHMYIHICVCIYIYMYICMFIYAYTHICIRCHLSEGYGVETMSKLPKCKVLLQKTLFLKPMALLRRTPTK